MFGTSYLNTFFREPEADALSLVRLVWCSLHGAPRFDKFLKEISKDKNFLVTAQFIQSQILCSLHNETDDSAENDGKSSEIDELDVLAAVMLADAVELIDKLPVFMIINAISRKTKLLSQNSNSDKTKKMKKMTPREMRDLYGGGNL